MAFLGHILERELGKDKHSRSFLIHLHELTTVFREEQKRCLFLWEPDWEKRERRREREEDD